MNISGYEFAGPYFHTKKFVKDFPCVYVLVNNRGQVVDVGETDSINARIITHERKMCWVTNGCPNNGLFIYITSDQNFRLLLERLIRLTYRPLCGQR